MAEDTICDIAMDILKERRDTVRDVLGKEYKNTHPLRTEKITDDELIYEFDTNGYKIFAQIARTQGMERAMQWKGEMEQLKQRRQKNA